MRALKGKLAVITGAAGGIGCATAVALAREGMRLVLCDNNEDALVRLEARIGASGDARISCVDVADRGAVAAFATTVSREHGVPDVVVNCAGVYICGNAIELTLEDWDWVLGVNLWGMIHPCHFFLPGMVARNRGGHVVNLVSMYGYWPSPCVAGYLTSKFGAFGYSRALREDLRPYGIGVSTVCPGIVNTGLVQTMRIRNGHAHEAALRAELQRTYERRNFRPEKVAQAIVAAITRNRGLVLVSPESRLMYQVERFLPRLSRFIAHRTAHRMFQPTREPLR